MPENPPQKTLAASATYPGAEDNPFLFTILIPTYNRAHLLPRAFESIEQQTLTDFEVIIVDDGSNDGTNTLVEKWAAKQPFPVRYLHQENQGKPAAYNTALPYLKGYFTIVLDSDDMMAKDALATIHRRWLEIPDKQKINTAGVEGLCAHFNRNDEIAGDRFPENIMDSNYIETRYRFRVSGDKSLALRTEITKAYPFPVFEGEKHMRESVIWCRMSHDYQFRCVNDIILYVEYQEDGLSAQPFQRRMSSPKSFRLAMMEHLNDHCEHCTFREKYRFMNKYIRYSFHGGYSLSEQLDDIKHKALWCLALPKGIIAHLYDKIKLHRNK